MAAAKDPEIEDILIFRQSIKYKEKVLISFPVKSL